VSRSNSDVVRLRVLPSNVARSDLEVIPSILGGDREARRDVGFEVATQALARTIFGVIPERVHQNSGSGDGVCGEDYVGSAPREMESTTERAEDVRLTIDVLLVDLEARRRHR